MDILAANPAGLRLYAGVEDWPSRHRNLACYVFLHPVRPHSSATKTFHHPDVGDLTLGYQSMLLEGTPGQRLSAYHAQPGSPDHDAMVLLDLTAPTRARHPASERL